MKAKNPKENSNRMDQGTGANTFDVFKVGWNQMQDKYDRGYQGRLKEANQNF